MEDLLITAVSELELSPDEFWNLSWYEWGLYLHRLKVIYAREERQHNRDWDTTRQLWATMVNLQSKSRVKPTDLIKLPYDENKPLGKKMTPEEVEAKYKKKRASKT